MVMVQRPSTYRRRGGAILIDEAKPLIILAGDDGKNLQAAQRRTEKAFTVFVQTLLTIRLKIKQTTDYNCNEPRTVSIVNYTVRADVALDICTAKAKERVEIQPETQTLATLSKHVLAVSEIIG